jgi:hypothetical protein
MLLGGGVTFNDNISQLSSSPPHLVGSGPDSPVEWSAVVHNPESVEHHYAIWIICANVGS